jgi:polar amino acid transport system substrate-binding protein
MSCARTGDRAVTMNLRVWEDPPQITRQRRRCVTRDMDGSRSLLDRAAIIPIAVCALLFGSTLGVTAQSPDASMAAASTAPAAISAACAKDALVLKNPGRLTLSTDNPAYPPWWGGTPPDGSEWELGFPASGEGYEGATAAAVASALGFTPEETDWLPNTVFENAFAPGPKPFDFHLAQISINPERAAAVDFSDPYFDSNQSVVALAANPITAATTIEELKAFRLGAATGTTSLTFIENVIQPTAEVSVFNDNAALVLALQNGQIDGLVADIYSGIFMKDVQLTDAVLAGRFDSTQQVDQMGLVLEKDSALTACVNEALAVIKSDGTLQSIYDQWIGGGEAIPVYQ